LAEHTRPPPTGTRRDGAVAGAECAHRCGVWYTSAMAVGPFVYGSVVVCQSVNAEEVLCGAGMCAVEREGRRSHKGCL